MSILDPFVDAVNAVADIATSVIDRVPGFSAVRKFLVDNPIIGTLVFTAIGSGLFQGLASASIPIGAGSATLGPQIASVAFAVPGIVFKRQNFVTAYVTDVSARAVATLAYFLTGPGAAALSAQLAAVTAPLGQAASQLFLQSKAADEVQRVLTDPLQKLVKESGFEQEIQKKLTEAQAKVGRDLETAGNAAAKDALRQLGVTPESYAVKYQVRPDVAALAINAVAGQSIYSVGDPAFADYDVLGNPRPGTTGPQGPPIPDVALAVTQDALLRLGYRYVGPLGVGTPNDAKIVNAVRDFQTKNQLPPTGKVDARTLQLMRTAIKLPQAAAEVRAIARPQLIRELQAVRAGMRPEPQGFLPQLATFAILTSPAWFTWLVLPRLRARKRTTKGRAR